MVNMAFLWIPNGTAAYEDGGAGGSAALFGQANYAAGYWAGAQALQLDGSFDYARADGALPPTISQRGWLAFRGKQTLGTTGIRRMVHMGVGSSGDVIAPYFDTNDFGGNTSGTFLTNGVPSTIQLTGAAPVGNEVFVYLQWDGTAVGVRINGGTLVSGSRSAPSGALASADFLIGTWASGTHDWSGTISAVAVGTGTLATSEIDELFTATEPWTFNLGRVNTSPVVAAGPDAGVVTGTVWTQSGNFTDSDGVSTSWTATVDYGDGGGAVPLTLNGDKTFTLGHTYTATGTYPVTVAVTDDGGLTGTDTVRVTVTEGPITGRFFVLGVAGTDASAPVITLPS